MCKYFPHILFSFYVCSTCQPHKDIQHAFSSQRVYDNSFLITSWHFHHRKLVFSTHLESHWSKRKFTCLSPQQTLAIFPSLERCVGGWALSESSVCVNQMTPQLAAIDVLEFEIKICVIQFLLNGLPYEQIHEAGILLVWLCSLYKLWFWEAFSQMKGMFYLNRHPS